MNRLTTGLVAVMVLLGAGCAVDAQTRRSGAHFMLVPQLGDDECSAGKSTSHAEACAGISFPVTVFLVPNRANVLMGCAAAMSYNNLTVHTLGDDVQLTWVLKTPGTRFSGEGVHVEKSDLGSLPAVLIKQAVGIDPADNRIFRLVVNASAAAKGTFPHVPVVEWNRSGSWVPCAGIDPGVVVSAD